jgi:hypothetical protein
MKCLACQSTNLVEGTVGGAEGAPIYFQIANDSAIKRLFGAGYRKLTGWACVHCGAVQLQVQLTDKDRKAFGRFDGPQVSVVDSDDQA